MKEHVLNLAELVWDSAQNGWVSPVFELPVACGAVVSLWLHTQGLAPGETTEAYVLGVTAGGQTGSKDFTQQLYNTAQSDQSSPLCYASSVVLTRYLRWLLCGPKITADPASLAVYKDVRLFY